MATRESRGSSRPPRQSPTPPLALDAPNLIRTRTAGGRHYGGRTAHGAREALSYFGANGLNGPPPADAMTEVATAPGTLAPSGTNGTSGSPGAVG